MSGSRGSYRQYSDTDLSEALKLIGEGKLSQAQAAKQFKIPRQTLNRLLLNHRSTRRGGGRPTTLTREEEENWIAVGLRCHSHRRHLLLKNLWLQ